MIDDELWAALAPVVPGLPWSRKAPGRRDRAVLEALARLAVEGGHWFDVPSGAGATTGIACWRRYIAWRDGGAWPDIWRVLAAGLRARGLALATPVAGHAITEMAPCAYWREMSLSPERSATHANQASPVN